MSEKKVQLDDLLRSINIIYDADQPDRIAHFQPTSKALSLLRALLGFNKDRTYFVSAPYGTGKSLVHTHLLQTIENTANSFDVLKSLANRVSKLDEELGTFLTKRANSATKGLVITLQGYQENLPKAIGNALESSIRRIGDEPFAVFFDEQLDFRTLDSAIKSIHRLVQDKDKLKIDRIVLIWDEFGRHLEELIAEGRSSDLNQLQTLAEFFSRSQNMPLTMSLLLHQSLMNYAGKVPQSIKKEWRKIEGRFETIQYIDDSKEIYQLIASVIFQLQKDVKIENIDFDDFSDRVLSQNILKDFSKDELIATLKKSYPLDPVALFMLPRISSRIAQHERTLFTFLKTMDIDKISGLPELYDYFSSSMSSDTSIGGTYHQWLEAESSISKTNTDEEVRILKSACLLGIGITGHRQRTTRALLELSSLDYYRKIKVVVKDIDSLIEHKLLLYRKNSDSVSIWHGTDVNIMGKLQEEKDRFAPDFDSILFIKQLIEPRHWKSLEYNNQFRITRYFKGEYLDYHTFKQLLSSGLDTSLESEMKGLVSYEDGRLFYLLPKSELEYEEMENILQSDEALHNQIVFALPQKPNDLNDLALEVYAYLQMQEDPKLVEVDPLILPELQQLTDDATDYLQKLIALMTEPSGKGPVFYYLGKSIQCKDSKALRLLLSSVMKKVFPNTPKLNNEMINRRFPRTTLINSRKKLCLSILEQAGEKDLLLEGFTPNVSFFRSLLLNTGLYTRISNDLSDDQWHFVLPEKLEDNGLRLVWERFQSFFTEEGDYKSLEDFYCSLKKPPYGLRDGVLPILTAAALRAFPSALSITDKKGVYLPDILASDIELIVSKPYEYKLSVKALTDQRVDYLTKILHAFDPDDKVSIREKDLIRRTYDALELWKVRLPKTSLISRSVSPKSKKLQDLLRKSIDPTHFLFKAIPSLYTDSGNEADINHIVGSLIRSKEELEKVPELYFETARKAVLSAIQLSNPGRNPVIRNTKKWLSYFDFDETMKIKDGTSRAFINRVMNPYKEDNQLLNSVSSLLRGKDITDWEDSDAFAFEKEILEVVHRIEDFVMSTDDNAALGESAKVNLAHLALNRMATLRDKMIHLVGESTVKEMMRDF